MRRAEATAAVFATILVASLGTVPAVGGYSNTVTRGTSSDGDFTTVGIVTQVESGAFRVGPKHASASEIRVGQGIHRGDRLWVEPAGLLRITDIEGGHMTFSGRTAVEFPGIDKVRVLKGSARIQAGSGRALKFETGYLAGLVRGEAAVWTAREGTQAVGIAGDVEVWHPHLASAKTALRPAQFTQSGFVSKQLQPKKPVAAGQELIGTFLARFEGSVEDRRGPKPELERSIASANEGPIVNLEARGSRLPSEVLEQPDEEVQQMMQARLAGQDIEEIRESPLATAGPQYDAYGQLIAEPKGRRPASEFEGDVLAGPRFRVIRKADKDRGRLDAEAQNLLKKFE